jgi:hypothetical protein
MLTAGVPVGAARVDQYRQMADELEQRAESDLDDLTGLFGELRRTTFEYSAKNTSSIQSVYDTLRELEAETTRHLFIELRILPEALVYHLDEAVGTETEEGLD